MENRVNMDRMVDRITDYDLIDKVIELANDAKAWEYKYDEEDYYEAYVQFSGDNYRIFKSIEDDEFLNKNEIKKTEYILFKKDKLAPQIVYRRVINKEIVYTKFCEKKIIYKK